MPDLQIKYTFRYKNFKTMKHLLIDFENIQPQNLDKLPVDDTHVWLFIGIMHKMLPVSLVKSLLRFGERAHLVHLQKTGKNALDFYLSYYLGQITATDPNAQIGILSRDGGYDILVEHILENRQAENIIRLANIEEVQHEKTPAPQPAPLIETAQPSEPSKPQQPLAPYFQAALTALRKHHDFSSRSFQDLQRYLRIYLNNLFSGKTNEECEATTIAVINQLKAKNLIKVDEQNIVSYHISDADLLQQIQRYILSQKPKTYADFQAAVESCASALCLNISQGDIQALARYLSEQNLIRQSKGKIEYAPFAEPKPQSTPKQPENYQPDETVWKKITAALSASKPNRPNKVSALRNMIKSLAKYSDQETEKLVQHLQLKKILRIDDTEIVYLQ